MLGKSIYRVSILALIAAFYGCSVSDIDPSSVQRESLEGNNVSITDDNVDPPETVLPTGTDAFAIGGPAQTVVTRLGNSVQISFNITAAAAPVSNISFTTDLSSVVSNLGTVTATVSPSTISLAANQTLPVTVTLATSYGAPVLSDTDQSKIALIASSTGFSKTFNQRFNIDAEVRFSVTSSVPSVWDIDSMGGSVALRKTITNLKVYLVNNTADAHQFHVNPTTYHANSPTLAGQAYMFTVPSLANQASIGWYFHNEENTVQAQFTNQAPTQ